jgi:hypothetical protein
MTQTVTALLCICGLLVVIELIRQRWEGLIARITALEKWRSDLEEAPKQQLMSELQSAIINFVLHRNHIEHRYFSFANDQNPPISADDQSRADELHSIVITIVRKAIRLGVTPEILLKRLEDDNIVPPVDLLLSIERARTSLG